MTHDHDHGKGHHAHRGHHPRQDPGHRDQHGNPEDFAGYLARLEEHSRAEWQMPEQVVQALALQPGQVVCDLGAGPGYFSLLLARAVGPAGVVLAMEVELKMLEVLRSRIEQAGLTNILPVLALESGPALPLRSCDLVLVVNAFHHFRDPVAVLQRLTKALKPGGRLVNIDFQKTESPVGPPIDHCVAREEVLALAAQAGLELVSEPTFLPYQYFLVLTPKRQP